MGTLIDEGTPTGVSTGAAASGTTDRDAPPTDAASAKQVILNAAQSGSGIVRLTTQAYSDAESGALTVLTGSADELGAPAYVILNAALGSALAVDDTWDDAVTAVGAS